MSQKREEEETLELKVSAPEAIAAALCPENCKISPPTTAASSICAGSGAPEPIRPNPSKNASPMATTPPEKEKEKDKDGAGRLDSEANAKTAVVSMKKAVNRCLCCGKRVGLTGFRCRCGELFCSVHRHSDRHDCIFDYKAAGREAIARENPPSPPIRDCCRLGPPAPARSAARSIFGVFVAYFTLPECDSFRKNPVDQLNRSSLMVVYDDHMGVEFQLEIETLT